MIALYVLSVAWFVLALVLALQIIKQADRHAEDREVWEEQRSALVEALYLSKPRPAPSLRRPPPTAADNAGKLAALKKAARVTALDEMPEPGVVITPTDL